MSNNDHHADLLTLIAHVRKHARLLDDAMGEIRDARESDIPKLGKTSRAGVLVAGLLENYYTCAETLFVRVSQFFENSLSPERWHKDLLEKMTLEIDSVRPALVSTDIYNDLVELMRFRHFKRSYFAASYDWIRLEELLKRLQRMHPILIADIRSFLAFLESLESRG